MLLDSRYILTAPVAMVAVLGSQLPNVPHDETCAPQIQISTVVTTETIAAATVTVYHSSTDSSFGWSSISSPNSAPTLSSSEQPITISQSDQSPPVIDPSDLSIGPLVFSSRPTLNTMTDGDSEDTPGTPTETISDESTTTYAETLIPSPWTMDITIDDETYHLPGDGQPPLELLLSTGATMTISSEEVSVDDETAPIPKDISDSQTFSVGDTEFTVGQPSTSGGSSGSDGGGDGFGSSSVSERLSGLTDTANSAASDLKKVIEGGKSWAQGGADSAMTGLSKTLDSATDSLGKITNLLRGIKGEIGSATELEQLTSEGRQIFKAYPELERGFDITKSLRKLVQGFPRLRNDAIKHMKKYWLEYASGTGALVAAEKAAKNFALYQGASKSQSTTLTPTLTTADAGSKPKVSFTGVSTSASATSTADTSSYIILTKRGTSMSQFKALTESIDGGAGKIIANDKVDFFKLYLTSLTETEAKEISDLDYVEIVEKQKLASERPKLHDPIKKDRINRRSDGIFVDEEHGRQKSKKPKQKAKRDRMVIRPNSPSYLKLLSFASPGEPTEDYLADKSLGEGITVYIVDSGFNVSPELEVDGRTISNFVVPNELSLDGIPPWDHMPEDLTDWNLHGTHVANVVGGKHFGVVPNANLYLVKASNSYWSTDANGEVTIETPLYNDASIATCFLAILYDIATNQRQGKAVVNMSIAIYYTLTSNILWEGFLEDLRVRDISFVTSASNYGESELYVDQFWPSALGGEDNALITVGGVEPDGSLWPVSTPHRDGFRGSITVYAQGSRMPLQGGQEASGTSLAAPVVAGLAAYFMAHPTIRNELTTGSIAMDVKKLIVRSAFPRAPVTIPPTMQNLGYPFPPELKVAYNLARGEPNVCAPNAARKRGSSGESSCIPLSSISNPTSTGSKVSTLSRTTFETSMKPAGETSSSSSTERTISCEPYAKPKETIRDCQCSSGSYTTHLPYLTSTDKICGYTTYPTPVTTAVPPPVTESDVPPYTRTDPMGNVVVCESSSLSEIAVQTGVTATVCVGSSTTISAASVAPAEPTEDVRCFPTHGSTDEDKVVELANLEESIDKFCASTEAEDSLRSNPTLPDDNPRGYKYPVKNNHYDAGYTKDDDAPFDCEALFGPDAGGIQQSLCSEPLKAIIKACPWNGGEVRNACGIWWLQSCPLGRTCPQGEPS